MHILYSQLTTIWAAAFRVSTGCVWLLYWAAQLERGRRETGKTREEAVARCRKKRLRVRGGGED